MKKLFTFLVSAAVCAMSGTLFAATTVNLPATSAINWSNADVTKASVQSDVTQLGSTGTSTVATFSLNNPTAQHYYLMFKTGHKDAQAKVEVTFTAPGGYEVSEEVDVVTTGVWNPVTNHVIDLGTVPTGSCSLTFKGTYSSNNKYCGNWGDLKILGEENFISLSDATALDWNDATQNATVESADVLGSTHSDTRADFNAIYVPASKHYYLTFKTGHSSDTPTINVTLTGLKGYSYSRDVTLEAIGDWAPATLWLCDLGTLPVDLYDLTFSVKEMGPGGNSYAGNWGYVKFLSEDGLNSAYASLLENVVLVDNPDAQYTGGLREVNGEIGYVRADNSASWLGYIPTEGIYYIDWEMARYNSGTATLSITDIVTGEVEKSVNFALDNSRPNSMTTYSVPMGTLTAGLKKLKIEFSADSDSFLCNFKNIHLSGCKPVYFIGSQTGNWTLSQAIPFTTTDGVTYTLTLPEGISGEWKICNGTWDWNFGTNGTFDFDDTDKNIYWNTNNCKSTTTDKAIITFTYVTGCDHSSTSTPAKIRVKTIRRLYFVGGQTDWLNNKREMATEDGFTYTLRVEEGITDSWKICNGTWDWSFGLDYVDGEALQDACPWLLTDARFKGWNYNFVTSKDGAVHPVDIEFTYIPGSDSESTSLRSTVIIRVNGFTQVFFDNTLSNWSSPHVHYWGGDCATIWPGVPMHRVDASEVPALAPGRQGVKARITGFSDIWEAAVPANTTKIIFSDKGANQTDGAGFDFVKSSVYNTSGIDGVYTGTTGVEEVEAEAETLEPVYYNLQGVRVDNPTRGIYIRVTGNKVAKVRID